MTCKICKGTGETLVPVKYMKTNWTKMASVPCFCLVSRLVSQENNLIGYLGDYYLPPDKMDPRLAFDPEDLMNNPNLILTGDNENFRIQVKALLMKNRFIVPKPRILFSRSISIVQDFHVPQDDDTSPHLSSLLNFDLVIVLFGTKEMNKALAPCMAQMIITRKEEKKPTWIYLPEERPTIEQCLQEKSEDLEEAVKDFTMISLSNKNTEVKNRIKKQAKKAAENFDVGKK